MLHTTDDIVLHECFRQQRPDDEDGEEEEEPGQHHERVNLLYGMCHIGAADVEKTQGYQSWLQSSTPRPQT